MLSKATSSQIRIGLVEIELDSNEDIYERIEVTLQLLNNIGIDTFDLIVLPELWVAGAFDYNGNSELDQELIRVLLNRIGEIALEKNVFIHSGTHPLVNLTGSLSNTAIIFNNFGEVVCSYEKMHLFGFEGGEKRIFTQGNVVGIFDFMETRVGVSTCYDLRFPELYISQVISGAKIILVSAAWPEKRIYQWRQLLVARAIESQAYVIGCNAGGLSDGVSLGFCSMAIDPFGHEITLELIHGIQKCVVDISELEQYRSSFPVLRDREVLT